MSQIRQQPLQIDGNQRLVLDDQDVGRNLPADLRAGFVEQVVYAVLRYFEDLGRLRSREVLDGNEQKRLTSLRRKRSKRTGGRLAQADLLPFMVLQPRSERVNEALIEPYPRRQRRKGRRLGEERFQQAGNSRIAGLLATGQQAGKPAQAGQVRRDLFS